MQRDRLQSALSRGVLVVAAETDSGTMNTVKSAIQQERRMAAYSLKLVDMTLNRYVADRGAMEIAEREDLRSFFSDVREESGIRQMTLFDGV